MSSFEVDSRLHGTPTFVPDAASDDLFVCDDRFRGSSDRDSGGGPFASSARAQLVALEEFRAATHRAGEEAGRKRAASVLDGVVDALETAAQQLDTQRNEYLQAQRRATVELAIAMARHVIGRAIESDPELLVERIDRAIALLSDEQPVLVQMNAGQYAALVENASPAFERMNATGTLRIEAAADLEADDVRVISGAARVDGSVASALERLGHELEGLERSASPEAGQGE